MVNIYQDLLLKNGLKFMINQKKNYNINKEIIIETLILRSDLWDFSDAYVAVKGVIAVTNLNDAKKIKRCYLKTMRHLSTTFSKLMTYKLTTQKS